MFTKTFCPLLSLRPELIANGGFETGNLNGWAGSISSTSASPVYQHSGRYALRSGPTGALQFLSQDVVTVQGQSYQLSFWLMNPGSSSDPSKIQFAVAFEPALTVAVSLTAPEGPGPALDPVALTLSTTTPFGWTLYQVTFTAPAATTKVKFGFRNDPSWWYLDDVTMPPAACTQDSDCGTGRYCDAGVCRTCLTVVPHWCVWHLHSLPPAPAVRVELHELPLAACCLASSIALTVGHIGAVNHCADAPSPPALRLNLPTTATQRSVHHQ